MFRTFIIMVLALGVGCADTPEREDSDESECPDWKVEIIKNDRIMCVDDYILEREREIIEFDRDDDW